MFNRKTNSNLGINILGHISGEYGLGEAVRSNIRAMESAGISFVLKDMKVDWHRNLDKTYTNFSEDNPYPINFIHLNPEEVKEVDPEYLQGKYNIGFWAWETPIFPPDRQWAFEPFDEIWTPSNYSGDGIAMASPVPVIRIPHSMSLPQPSLTREDLDLPEDRFIFLFMFDLHGGFERKNPLATIKAFRKAFGKDNEDVLLILKFSNSKYHSERLEQIKSFVGDDSSIFFLDLHLMRDEIDALIYNSDCYVSLHRSEGFGLTIAESMYYGKPVIATAYSSNIEFMNVGNSYLVPYNLIELEEDTGVFQKGNNWADPDVDYAANLMQEVVSNPQEAKQVGNRAAKEIKSLLSPVTLGERIRSRLEQIMKMKTNPTLTNPSDISFTEIGTQSYQSLAWMKTAEKIYGELKQSQLKLNGTQSTLECSQR